MLKRDYEGQNCSIARALEIVGERWTLLIIRDAFLGVTRFEDFHERLGISRNVLNQRVGSLVDAGVLERVASCEHPPRYDYRLTDKGRDLWPVVTAMRQWGDRWAAPDGPPILYEHAGCGGGMHTQLRCTTCGDVPASADVTVRPGPGFAVA